MIKKKFLIQKNLRLLGFSICLISNAADASILESDLVSNESYDQKKLSIENPCAKKLVAIVDGYSSGNLLAKKAKVLGFDAIHIQTNTTHPSWAGNSFHADDYEAKLTHGLKSVENPELIEKLRDQNIIAVIPGSDSGVALADWTSERLGLATNGSEHTSARRNKYRTHEKLGELGAAQLKSNNVEELVEWATKIHKKWPVIVKPLEDGGTTKIKLCNNEQEIREGFNAIYGTMNSYGQRNDEVLIQEFLDGPEFIVETVSTIHPVTRKPVHKIIYMMKYHSDKIEGAAFLNTLTELLPEDGEIQSILSEYALKVLTKVEMKYGAAHLEIKLTSRGPVLVEINPRMGGAGLPPLILAAKGIDEPELTIKSYLDPQGFLAAIATPPPLNKSAYIVLIKNEKEGAGFSNKFIHELKTLPSFFAVSPHYAKDGAPMARTVDLDTTVAVVHLVNSDSKQLKEDIDILRSWEKNHIFVLK